MLGIIWLNLGSTQKLFSAASRLILFCVKQRWIDVYSNSSLSHKYHTKAGFARAPRQVRLNDLNDPQGEEGATKTAAAYFRNSSFFTAEGDRIFFNNKMVHRCSFFPSSGKRVSRWSKLAKNGDGRLVITRFKVWWRTKFLTLSKKK